MLSDEIQIDFLCELLSCGRCRLKEHSCCPHFHKHTHRGLAVTPSLHCAQRTPPYPWKPSNADAGQLVIDSGLKEMWRAVMGYWVNQLRYRDGQGCVTQNVNRVRLSFQRNRQKPKYEMLLNNKKWCICCIYQACGTLRIVKHSAAAILSCYDCIKWYTWEKLMYLCITATEKPHLGFLKAAKRVIFSCRCKPLNTKQVSAL